MPADDTQTQAPAPPRIEVRTDGPLVLHGGIAVKRARQVETEHGEPVAWQTTEVLETRDTVSLCRCGASERKPFCDGSHARSAFDGTEAAPTTTYDERATTYEGTGVVVRDDRALCQHAGFCGTRATNVWKLVGGDATEDTTVRAQVMAMVERCPSGALTYRLDATGDDVEPELAMTVRVVDDGPLFVSGGLPVVRADGQPFEPRNRVTLCRCGASSAKPQCDGSHKRVGFADAADAPGASGGRATPA